MDPNIQMTQAEADAYMEQFKRNVAKVLSVSKEDVVRAETAKVRTSLRKKTAKQKSK
jgi:hypothetical protein